MAGKGLYLPEEVVTDTQIGAAQKIVLAVMLANADEDGICRMSAKQIGDVCGMTYVAAQQNRLKLCQYGYAELCPNSQRNYRLLRCLRCVEADHGN